jgi:transposase-like protein
MSGDVEVDETYIGGKARFMHKDKRARVRRGRSTMGKVAVMGLLERHSKTVRVEVLPNVRQHAVQSRVRAHVNRDSVLHTDAFSSYEGLHGEYIHKVIDHAERYVDGEVHTNGMENFWSLLKRAIKGTYVSVEPFHLFRYVDEQAFRFNQRKLTDAERFSEVLDGIVGRRVMFTDLTAVLAGNSPA